MLSSASLLLSITLAMTQAAAPPAAGRITGRVVADADNAPMSGVRLILMPMRPGMGPMGPLPQATSDSSGQFAFDAVPAGDYRLDAQRTGFYLPQPASGPPKPVTVVAGQASTIDVRLKKGAVIAGRILDDTGAPLPDVRVIAMRRLEGRGAMPSRLVPAPMSGQMMMQTNDIGEFRITGLAAGTYYVAGSRSMTALGGAGSSAGSGPTLATTYYPGTTDQNAALAIAIAEGDTKGGIEFRMQMVPSFRISGLVVDEQGQPVARAMVMVMSDPRTGVTMGPIGNSQTGDDGRFTIGQVPSGSYRITASVPLQMASGGSWASVSGGVTGGFVGGTTAEGPPEVVVGDADVSGVKVMVKRPQPR